jgi:hypothetical protein
MAARRFDRCYDPFGSFGNSWDQLKWKLTITKGDSRRRKEMEQTRKRYRMDDDLRAKWHTVCARRRSEGLAGLSDVERVWMGVRAVLDASGDGGVISYFYNNWANDISNSLWHWMPWGRRN